MAPQRHGENNPKHISVRSRRKGDGGGDGDELGRSSRARTERSPIHCVCRGVRKYQSVIILIFIPQITIKNVCNRTFLPMHTPGELPG